MKHDINWLSLTWTLDSNICSVPFLSSIKDFDFSGAVFQAKYSGGGPRFDLKQKLLKMHAFQQK